MARWLTFMVVIIAMTPSVSHAYVGPGAGLGAITAAVALVAAIVMGFFAFLYYPLKRMFKKNKPSDTVETKTDK